MIPLLLSVGILYFLALGAGRLAAKVQVPRVTGYLFVGLLAGPSVAHLSGLPPVITAEQLKGLLGLQDFIIGLIVLTIGGSFSLQSFRKLGTKLLVVSSAEIGCTVLLVGGGAVAVGMSPVSAGFLAIMAAATAPAVTQMVIREYESEGLVTDTVLPLIGLNNLFAIIVFVLIKNYAVLPDVSVSTTLAQIFAPVGIGVLGGSVLALMDQRLTRPIERQILILATVALLVGISEHFALSPMLTVFVAGVVAVNASPHEKRIIRDLSAVDYPLYVLFFIMAGAKLHLDYLPNMGLIGVLYIVARMLGKSLGCSLGTRLVKAGPSVKKWLGFSMLSQGGLAIGLASMLAREWPGPGENVQMIILSAVVVFEVAGPLLTRTALVHAGEVTVLHLLVQRSPVGYGEGLHEVVNHFKNALGFSFGKKVERPGDIPVGHIMRKNVETIDAKTPFDDVLRIIGHSRYDRLPVVNGQKELEGVISYADVSSVLFEDSLRHLLVAGDIATPATLLLNPEDTLEKAMNELKNHPDHSYLLVVDKDNPKKISGVVRHNDVLSAQRR
jgi:Kef-type K+ transport system membrane component KefB/CBS domain-containing protein